MYLAMPMAAADALIVTAKRGKKRGVGAEWCQRLFI